MPSVSEIALVTAGLLGSDVGLGVLIGGAIAFMLMLLLRGLHRHGREQGHRQIRTALPERFLLAVDGAQEALWHWSAEDDTLAIAGRSRETIGLPPHPTGMSLRQWRKYIHREDRPLFDAEVRRFVRREADELRCSYRIVDEAGTVRHVRVRGIARRDRRGRIREAAGSIGNWTEQTNREQQLLLLERAIQSTTDGVLIADARAPDQPLIFVNSGFERITGYDRESVLGRNCRFLQNGASDQEGVPLVRTALKDARPATMLLRNFTRDGALFWNQLSLAPVHTPDGQVSHFVGIMSDVTARLEAERARQRLQQELEQAHRVQHLAALVGGIAHDVHNALVPIISLSQILRDGLTTVESAAEISDRIHRAGLSIQGLVRTVLDRSRRGDGQELEPVDLAEVVRESLNLLKSTVPGAVRLHSEVQDVGRLMTARTKIHQIVMNLVTNAVHALSSGTGTIKVTLERPGDDEISLSVEDDGVGMSEETRRRAVEPFYSDRPSGLGLGLTIVQVLVREQGGRVRIDSALGAGTRVQALFPLITNGVDPR